MDTIIKTINGLNTMNLDKRIKRHVIGARHVFFAITLPGFENLLRLELEGLCPTLEFGAPTKGGVAFNGRLTDLYLANLHLSTAGRILMRLAAFKAAGVICPNSISRRTIPVSTIPRLWLSASERTLRRIGPSLNCP
jgi:hypothetical protein